MMRWGPRLPPALCLALFLAISPFTVWGRTCEICADGADPLYGDVDIAHMVPEAANALQMSSISCSFLASLVRGVLKEGSNDCNRTLADQQLPVVCGCPEFVDESSADFAMPQTNASETSPDDSTLCQMCPGGYDSIPDPDYIPQGFPGLGDFPAELPCSVLYNIAPQFPADSLQCTGIEDYLGFYCGCRDTLSYLNAEEHWQKVLITWLPRIAGLFSAFGSIFIIYDVRKRSKKQQKSLTMFQEILLGISCFDLCSAVAHISSSLAIPVEDKYGQLTGVYGAHGNMATCKAQGFFITLGITGECYQLLRTCLGENA